MESSALHLAVCLGAAYVLVDCIHEATHIKKWEGHLADKPIDKLSEPP